MSYRPARRAELALGISATWARPPNGPSPRSSRSPSRRSAVRPRSSRTWLTDWVASSRVRNSTARAGQRATSAASSTSTARVPLRRRVATVRATSARPSMALVQPLALGRGRLGRLSHAERLVSHQVADVGDDPVLAGLDEPVAVELVDVGLHDVDLRADDLQQLAQHAACGGVGGTVVLGEQVVEAVVWHGGHGVIWVRTRESGTSGVKMATWAGLITQRRRGRGRGRRAGRRSTAGGWALSVVARSARVTDRGRRVVGQRQGRSGR